MGFVCTGKKIDVSGYQIRKLVIDLSFYLRTEAGKERLQLRQNIQEEDKVMRIPG